MAAADFWNNRAAAQTTVIELKGLNSLLKPMDEAIRVDEEIQTLVEMGDDDPSFIPELRQQLDRVEPMLDELELKSLLSGPHDANAAILSINARDGGTDANDWAEMMLRMYLQWAQKNGYETELLDRQDDGVAGIQHAAISIRGPMAYGYLKGETGMHRLVRISPFNAEGKRQTSFAAIDVSPEINDTFEVELKDEDIREDVFRASGAGGQHVNKTSSAIRLTHLPTNIVVQCQNERSQHQNRAAARKMLAAKLYQMQQEKKEADVAARRGAKCKIGFGGQTIRNYVLQPEQFVKDTRSELKTNNPFEVLDGKLDEFIEAYLRWSLVQ